MKKSMLMILVLALLLMSGTAWAMPIQLTNGDMTVSAYDVRDGVETDLTLRAFHLLGVDENGAYLIYYGQELFTVEDAKMDKLIGALYPENVPLLNGQEPLGRGDARVNEVAQLQRDLFALGYLQSSVDGDYGVGTENAVKAFQADAGLEQTGQADEVVCLLLRSLREETVQLEGEIDPQVMFAPIAGRTNVDIQPVIESGLTLVYDDMTDVGFISDGKAIEYDASGEADLDKHLLTIRFGLLTREDGEGQLEVLPVAKISCLCVRRPGLASVILKSGDLRGNAAVGDLRMSLDGIYTVEQGLVVLNAQMVDALANAEEAGELKLRIEGTYLSFDVQVDESYLGNAARIGKVAQQLAE